ncbi:hypothetical protein [Xenorhabdus sp. PB30.3]|uniref:hypothetical protein n=1 Tax=Xenorhabdus sp. PB30.3 TaxID=2788941 RepID=UPI001E40D0E6|nr:hypothetical protein [Xenorhabdus sp. PB30.3]MCC8382065.1 hypothetical protein [Xenorhabdus sp. PB30.3]
MNEFIKIGRIINPPLRTYSTTIPVAKKCTVIAPARVDTFLCKTQYFVDPPLSQFYPIGSINFVVNQYTTASVEINTQNSGSKIYSSRNKIISHFYQIIKKVLNFKEELIIKAENQHNIIHGGLGSTVSLVSAIAIAINELYGCPLSSTELITFLSRNYGEESEEDEYVLHPAASIGGGFAASLLPGDIIIMQIDSGEPLSFNLHSSYKIVTFFPELQKLPSGYDDYQLTVIGYSRLKNMGLKYGEIRKNILEEIIIPSLKSGDYADLFFYINQYTLGRYGNIPEYFSNRWATSGLRFEEILSFISNRIFSLFSDKECCFFVSSGGPLISIITPDAHKTVQSLQGLSGKLSVLDLHNSAAIVKCNK